MNELGKGFDGTIEKAIASTEKLKGLPEIVQKFMMLGDYKSGLITKIDGSTFEQNENGKNIQNYVAQIANLDEAQRKAIESVTELNTDTKDLIDTLVKATQTGSRINGKVFEANLKSAGDGEINQGDVNSLMNALGMKNGDNYALPDTNEVKKNLNMWAKAAENADAKTRLMNAGIIESTKNGYAMTDSFKKMIGIEEVDGVVKVGLTAKQLAWNAAMQIGKQLALSFGVAIATWAVSKAVEYLMNLKTRSEELVETMNESHDAAEQATKDVEEIQSKIDELNNSLEAAGVKKIEEIVDPAERERLQAINDMLQAQLELKNQLEKDANDKANEDTNAVVNDKTEKSIVKKKTIYLDANNEQTDDPHRAITTFENIGEDITKTESLQEHSDYLDELVAKRRELATAGQEDTQAYKDNEAEIEKETEKVQELSSVVSKQMDVYETDADSFAQYKDEYVAGTNAMTAATKALANANDDVGVSTTNYDILLQKIRAAKNEIDNGTEDRKGYGYVRALDTLTSSGLETGDDIRELSMVPANQTKEQAAAIAVLQKAADAAHVTLDQFISALESVGLISVRDTSKVKSLSDAMSALDNMQSAYQSCAQAVKEYNKTGYVTMDTLQSLCQLEPQYLHMLELKNGKLKINTKTAQSLTQANIQLAKASLLADTLNNIKENNNLAKAKSILGDVTAVIKDADTALAAAAQKSQNEAKDSGGWEAYDYTSRANSVLIDNYHTLSELLDTLSKQDPSKIWGKDDKSTKQATSAIDAWSTLSAAMEEYNKQGSISLNTMKSLMGLEEKYTACLKKQGNELTIDATNFRNMIQTELAAAAATADASDKTKAKVSQYTQILKYLDENAKEGTISLNELRDAIEGVGTSLDKAQEKTSGLKSAFGTIHDILNTDNPAGALTSDNVESVIDLIQEHSELKDILYDESGTLQINEESLKKATIALLENGKAATKDVAIQAILQKSIDDLSSGVISITDYLKGLNTELDDIDSKLDKFQSGFSDITDIVDEYNQYGKLTQDSMQKLLRLDPKYLECLEKEGDQLKFNAAQYRMLYAEQVHQFALNAKTTSQRKVYSGILSDIFGFTPEQTEEYESALQDYADKVKEVQDSGAAKYGNVDNINRSRIDWTAENMEKYHDFVAEQNELEPDSIVEGGYSTVLGASSAFDTGDGEKEIAFTPMLQTEDGAVPLTEDEIYSYINDVIEKASKLEGGATAENILKVDSEGLLENVAGDEVKVKNMIAAIQVQVVNGAELTAADVAAIGGETAENLEKYFGETSKYANQSMHDVQAKIFDSKENVEKLTAVLEGLGIDGAKALQLLEEHFSDANKYAENFKTTLSNIKSVFSDLVSLFNTGASNQTNDLQLWADALNDEIDERIKKLDKQKEALEKENEAEERAIELTKAQDALARAQSQHTARVYGGNGYEWEASSADVRSAQQDFDDKRRQYRQADAEKAIEDEKKALNDLKDEYAKITKLIGKSLKDYNKQMKYTAQIQAMTLQDMKDNMTSYKDSVLENMKFVSAGTSMSDALSNLEKLISTLETLNDIYTAVSSHLQNTDGGGPTGLAKNLNTLGEDIYNKGFGTAMKDFLGKFKDDVWETLATSDNSIVQMFRNAWTLIEDGAAKFFTSEGLGKTIGTGLQNMGGSVGNWVGGLIGKASGDALMTQLPSLAEAATAGTGGVTSLAGIASSVGPYLPIIGAIAVGVNNIFQQTKKTVSENEKLWADTSKSTGEKIVGSIGNVLYHLGPVEGWDKSIQYAKKAAEGDGIWEKISNGFKSVYYASGLGVMLDNIWTTIKAIFHIQDKASKKADSNSTTTSTELDNKNLSVSTTTTKTTEASDPTGDDSTKKKKWYESKVWFWNWGKKATGDKGIKKSNLYNVDEQGSELIVRQPASGRYTYLETGDGVVPADITSKLFEMGGNPDKWFSDQMAKYSTNGIQTRNVDSSRSISIGDVVVNNPVGDADALARALVQKLPSAIDQRMNKR